VSSRPDTREGGWESRDLVGEAEGSRFRTTPLAGLRNDNEEVREFGPFVFFVFSVVQKR
jgi:hypothetical protein